jgi:lipopolysaccharide transport system ATP-binding protein
MTTPPGELLLDVKGLAKAYPGVQVLSDVNFQLTCGEVHALVGENGAGKSTLLQAIAGITAIDSGGIETSGQVGALLELGCGFHPELNGYENCYLQGAILGLPRELIAERLPAIIEYAGIGEAMERPVRFYSSGMFARLAFSLSIHIDPDILLVDEILAVGDREFQTKSLRKLVELQEAGKTVVLVSHMLSLVTEICDRAMWLGEGKLLEYGAATEVIGNYTSWINHRINERGEHAGSRFGFIEEVRRSKKTKRQKLVEEVTGRFQGEIRSLRLLDGDGRPAAPFHWRDELTLQLEYDIPRPVEGMRLKCLIVRSDGYIIHEYDSAELSVENGFSPRGSAAVTFTELPFHTGRYQAVVGFFHEGDRHKDIRLCERAAEFEVASQFTFARDAICIIPGSCKRID